MNQYNERSVLIKRFLGCLAGGVVFALMWGPQEGNQSDYGYAFRQAVFKPRIFVFLALGVLTFLAITYWSHFKAYLTRPGAWPLAAGTVTVLAAMTLLHWDDTVGNAKFSDVSSAAAATSHLAFTASAFFGWLAWTQLAVLVVLLGVAAVRRIPVLAWVAAVGCVIAAIDGIIAHREVAALAPGHDHSLGSASAALGYLVMASAAVTIANSNQDMAATRAFVDRAFAWRPGLILVVGGLIAGVIAVAAATWYAPQSFDATLHDTHTRFAGYGLSKLVTAYLGWLCYVLLAASALAAGAGSWARNKALGWTGAAIGVVAVLLTLDSIYDVSKVGAKNHVDAATGPWQNLGAGGWLACIAFFCIGAGGFLAATSSSVGKEPDLGRRALAVPSAPDTGTRTRLAAGATASRSLIVLGIALALFYPPTTTLFWQKVLVGEIGVYVPARRRPQRRRRLGRTARPRLHRVLRHRLLHHGLPRRLAAREAAGLVAHVSAARDPVRDRHLPGRRPRAGCTDPTAAR